VQKEAHRPRRAKAKALICHRVALRRLVLGKEFVFSSIGKDATTRTKTNAAGAYMYAG
jgi:hypothetical protein